jgi:DNA polymerase-3 subunit delta
LRFQEFKIQAQNPEPVYLFITDQDFLKSKMAEFCEAQVEESSRAFDWMVFDLKKDKTIDLKEQVQDLINTARTLPWMNQRRWIYVKNAQNAGKELDSYLNEPAEQTVLVLQAGRKPKSWAHLPTVDVAEKLDSVTWVTQRARKAGFEIDRDAAETLVSLVGEELARLDSELEKQLLWSLDTKRITVDSVLGLAVEARGRDIFELISAMAGQNCETALRVLHRLFEMGTSHQLVLSMLYWNFRRLLVAKEMLEDKKNFSNIVRQLKIWSYRSRQDEVSGYSHAFLSGVLWKLRETDRLFKSTPTDPKAHLERVIIDTCGNRSV